ncbi:MAG: serine/threonine-protein kinase [Myxococcota bacterium]
MSNIEPTPFGDKYVLVEHIATGGMAEIYRAQYAGIEGFAKELVVKTLREEFAARPDVVGMFLDEARVAATLTHNNVVHTYDLGEIGSEYFIAMELLKGEELVAVLRASLQQGRAIPLELAIGIVMQSCEGLHYVHSRVDDQKSSLGLVHRDINPTNIHVGYDGLCKILDFGIAATRASAVAKKGQVAGKLAYMAPEQLQGQPLDGRADIFPLGVILYEMCLQRRLFRGPREEVTQRVIEGDIPPPTFVDPNFPPQLEAIIMKALEVDPSDRYHNCDHMFRDLEAFLQERGLSPTPRKLSAMMVELFGEGKPAAVDYDDQYDDLEDDALDFGKFDGLSDDGSDDAPEWARSVEARSPSTSAARRASIKIGNIEALVAEGKLEDSGPSKTVPVAGKRRGSTSGHHRVVGEALAEDGDDEGDAFAQSEASGARRRPGSGKHRRSGGRPGSGPRATPGSGRHAALNPTGPLAAVAPDGASGRTFGHSVVSEQSKKPSAVLWLIGLIALSGIGWFAYTLLTTK